MRGDQREPGHGPAAAAEDLRRLAGGHRQQAVHAAGLLPGRHLLARPSGRLLVPKLRVLGTVRAGR